MQRLVGKIAVVTGASSGVGAAVAVDLVKQGMVVIGVARRVDKVEALQKDVAGAPGKLVPVQGDVSSEAEINKIFDFVKSNYKTMHVLVNNAGFTITGKFIDGNPADWKKVLDVNVLGVATCAKLAINLMMASGVNDGQVINVNSIAGHRLPHIPNPNFNIYPPSKFAVTAISETLRQEMAFVKSKIRVTNLCPGYIKTEFVDVAVKGTSENKDEVHAWTKVVPGLTAEDLADTVRFILSAPPHVQVNELIMVAV